VARRGVKTTCAMHDETHLCGVACKVTSRMMAWVDRNLCVLSPLMEAKENNTAQPRGRGGGRPGKVSKRSGLCFACLQLRSSYLSLFSTASTSQTCAAPVFFVPSLVLLDSHLPFTPATRNQELKALVSRCAPSPQNFLPHIPPRFPRFEICAAQRVFLYGVPSNHSCPSLLFQLLSPLALASPFRCLFDLCAFAKNERESLPARTFLLPQSSRNLETLLRVKKSHGGEGYRAAGTREAALCQRVGRDDCR
jgi:hypothetical protein